MPRMPQDSWDDPICEDCGRNMVRDDRGWFCERCWDEAMGVVEDEEAE